MFGAKPAATRRMPISKALIRDRRGEMLLVRLRFQHELP
jgi:hypothetical protein